MRNLYLYLALIGLLSGGLFYIKHQLDKVPKLEAETKNLKEERKTIERDINLDQEQKQHLFIYRSPGVLDGCLQRACA